METRVCQRDANHTETRPVTALGHDYVSTVTNPTCTEQGYTTYNCSRCEASYIGDYVDALGHNYKDTVIAPTYRNGGYTHHECERCQDMYDDTRTDRLPLYYIVPSLAEQEATLIFKSDDAEYEVTSTDGRFEINDIPVDTYRIYVRADLCLCIAVETYEITDNEYICEETVAMPIGDVNADNYIDFADLSVLLANGIYGCENEQLDLTGDGMISVDDIALALREENYGKASVTIR